MSSGIDTKTCAHARFETTNIGKRHHRERRTETLCAQTSDLPKFFEVRESPLYGYLSCFDCFQACSSPQVTHYFNSRRVNTRRVHKFKSHLAQLNAERFQRETAAQNVPSVGRDHAARTHHPRHLCNTSSGIGHKKDN